MLKLKMLMTVFGTTQAATEVEQLSGHRHMHTTAFSSLSKMLQC